ncbi:hypothetical protein A31E_00209, partial [Escherichia sp. KTE159]
MGGERHTRYEHDAAGEADGRTGRTGGDSLPARCAG